MDDTDGRNFPLAFLSELFQKCLNVALNGLKGVNGISDDTNVYGSGDTVETANHGHDKNITAWLWA